jgi:hypothetical protein
MTPLLMLQLVKTVAIVAGAWIVLRRFSFREFPALLLWMLCEVACQVATLDSRSLPGVALIVRSGVCAAAICEVVWVSRLDVRLDIQIRVFLAVVAGAKILASIPELTTVQSWYLFRSYFLWAAFLALGGISLLRWRRPVLERSATRIYRLGATAWVFTLAVSGSFVKGGLGYKILPYTKQTWMALHTATCLVIAVTVIVMATAMYRSVPGRKKAAKDTQGRTRTGLIVMERRGAA